MGTLTLGCFSSLVGSKSLDFTLKLAKAAVDKGHKVNLWLSGNATVMGKAHQKHLKDYSLKSLLWSFWKKVSRFANVRHAQWPGAFRNPMPSPGFSGTPCTGI